MSFLSSFLTPSDDYNYKIIFWSYFALTIAMIALYVASKFWKDIEGFWIVLSPYILGLPYYGWMWMKQRSIKEKSD